MYPKDTKKEVYEAPAVKKQQVLLEQAIAAVSRVLSNDGEVQHEWIEEEINNDDLNIII